MRCGNCQEIFNGKENLRENISANESKTPPPATQPIPPAVPPSQPAAEKDLSKSTGTDFDQFDLGSIPDSNAEEEDWFEEVEKQTDADRAAREVIKDVDTSALENLAK